MPNYHKEFMELPPGKLIPYEDNPRLNDDAVEFVANSVEDFDFNDPIEVNEDYVILSGHTRQKAALRLGIEKVPVIVIHGMPESDQMAYRIAANKTQEKAGWDFEKLDRQVDDLLDQDFDMERYGLDLSYLADRDMSEEDYEEDADGGEEKTYEDGSGFDIPSPDDEPFIRKGDLLLLGPHRVLCGDATSAEDMARLMDGRVADIAFTSPPYNAGYVGREDRPREGRKYLHDEDKRTEEDFDAFLMANLGLLIANSTEVFYNMGVVSGSKRTIIRLLNHFIDNFKDFVYWQKTNPVPSVAKGVISSSTELIMAFGKNGSRAFRKDLGIWYGIIHGTTVGFNPYKEIHKATFPLYLPVEVIETFSNEGDSVLDCFLGTGTTLIACEDTSRKCYGMDIEPLYVQIAAERWISRVGSDEDVKIIRDSKVYSYRSVKERSTG